MWEKLRSMARKHPEGVGAFLFFVAFSCVALALLFYINKYPFSTIPPERWAAYLPWVQALTPPSHPYQYWYPVVLVGLPLGTYFLWRGMGAALGLRVSRRWFDASGSESAPKLPPFSSSLIIFLLAVVLSNFSYAAFYVFFVNFHHYNYITGPLNDLLHGKTLLIDSITQYGFLNILFASWIFKGPLYFSHANVHWLSMVFTLIEYAAYYLTLRLLTRSTFWSIMGILFTLSVHYYGPFPDLFPSELPVWPGNTWRFMFVALSSVGVLLWVQRRTRFWFLVSQAGMALSLFWQFESGICAVGAYLACLASEAWLVRRSPPLSSQREDPVAQPQSLSFFWSALSLLGWIAGIVVVYSVSTWLLVGKFPHWSLLTYYTKVYNDGLIQGAHIPSQWQWYWPAGVYLLTLVGIFGWIHLSWNFPIKDLSFLIFLSVYGLGIFRYYLGYGAFNWRPVAIVVPACLLLSFVSQGLFEFLRLSRGRFRGFKRGFLSFVFWCGVVPLFGFHAYNASLWTYKLNKNRLENLRNFTNSQSNVLPRNRLVVFEATTPSIPFDDLLHTLEAIKLYVPEGAPMALLAHHDHPLLMQSQRVNLANSWYLSQDLFFHDQIDSVVKLYEDKAPYVFVEKDLFRRASEVRTQLERKSADDNLLEIWIRLRKSFRYKADLGLLYVYERVAAGDR